MKCIVICRGPIESAFPIMNIAINIKKSKLFDCVTLVCSSCKEETKKLMTNNQIELKGIDQNYSTTKNIAKKFRNWYLFRKRITSYFKRKCDPESVMVYVGTGDSALAI